jgi:hypothetical protein
MHILQLNMIFDKKDRILMLDVCFLFESPKVALNYLRKVSNSLSKGDWCFNKSANQARAMFYNKVPMSPTWTKQVGYPWRWSRMTKHAWLTKPWNFECMPSNLLSKLICDFFGWDFVIKTHPIKVEAWLVCKWTIFF